MTDAPRGPTTEELRARVLAHHRREAEKNAAQAKRETGLPLEKQVRQKQVRQLWR